MTAQEPAQQDQGSDGAAFEIGSERAGRDDVYAVKLPVFEGPLDLLLHLIRQNEVEITEIPIAEITAQYLRYLELMQSLNLDVAGEYLVTAATLALIKSRMLLPSESEDELDPEDDPRALLIARLLEYERYKEVAEELSKRRLLGRDVFVANPLGLEPVPEADRELEVGLFELIDAFRLMLENAPKPQAHEVEGELVSVRDRMIFVMEVLERDSSIDFNQIFESADGSLPRLPVIVATFLAMLELTRLTAITIYQGASELGAPEGPIRLRRVEHDPQVASDGPPSDELSSEQGAQPFDWRAHISELM